MDTYIKILQQEAGVDPNENRSLSSRRNVQLCKRKSIMIEIVKIVCPQKLKCLAALDGISERDGRQNFAILLAIVIELQNITTTTRLDELSKQIHYLENFIKSKMDINGLHSEAHFGGCACGTTNDERNHGPNCHCSYFWFGGMDQSAEQSEKEFSLLNNIPRSPCGHCHQGTCSYCEPMFTFITNFKIEVEEILSFSSISNSERSAVNMIKVKYDYHFNRYNNIMWDTKCVCAMKED
jgi:hypothetical protein